MPKSRLDFWLPKLEGNAERDRRNLAAAADLGWRPVVIWECETLDTARLADAVERIRAVPPTR